MDEREREKGEPRVVGLALELLEYCDSLEGKLLRRGKAGLNEHLQDSAASALANVGEAWDERNPREKRRFLGYALRSAGECQRMLRGAARVRAITSAELTEALHRIRALKRDIMRLRTWCERQPGL